MKRVLKIIVIIIAILLILYISISIYKFCIVNKIQNKNNEYKNSDNYYFSSSFKSDNHKQEYYFKDNQFKSLDDGVLTVYGNKDIQYYVNKDGEIIDEDNGNFYRRYPSLNTIFSEYEFDNVKEQILFALSFKNWISVLEHNGQKCYKISDSEQNVYFDKDTLIPVEIESVKHTNNTTDYDKVLEVKLDVVTDENMKIDVVDEMVE